MFSVYMRGYFLIGFRGKEKKQEIYVFCMQYFFIGKSHFAKFCIASKRDINLARMTLLKLEKGKNKSSRKQSFSRSWI